QTAREHRPLTAAVATQVGAQWSDYRAAIAAVEARQLALRRTGALARVDIAEEANTDAFVRALVDLADSLHASPAELRERATTGTAATSIARPRFDLYAARYGVRVGLATTISYLIGIVADTAELFNVLWHPAFLAVSSYGATIRRAGTRFAGTVIGCLVAIVATIAVMPNISELPALALVLFDVTVPSAYVAVGGPRFWYARFQSVVALVMLAVGGRPEAAAGGVAPQAAAVAGARAVRNCYRLAAVYGERSANPGLPLSESLQRALGNVETAVRAWLEIPLRMLEARHTMARPGSRGYRQAYAAAAAVTAQPRPDLAGPLSTLQLAIEAARPIELSDWPQAARGALVAEIEHFRRVVELLPSLDEYLRQMTLTQDPGHPGVAGLATVATRPKR